MLACEPGPKARLARLRWKPRSAGRVLHAGQLTRAVSGDHDRVALAREGVASRVEALAVERLAVEVELTGDALAGGVLEFAHFLLGEAIGEEDLEVRFRLVAPVDEALAVRPDQLIGRDADGGGSVEVAGQENPEVLDVGRHHDGVHVAHPVTADRIDDLAHEVPVQAELLFESLGDEDLDLVGREIGRGGVEGRVEPHVVAVVPVVVLAGERDLRVGSRQLCHQLAELGSVGVLRQPEANGTSELIVVDGRHFCTLSALCALQPFWLVSNARE